MPVSRKGVRGMGACLSAVVILSSVQALAIPLDPSGGPLFIGDSIGFNLAQAQLVFDKSEGSMGELIPVGAASGAGWVSTSSPGYGGAYTFRLDIHVPLTADISSLGNANGIFGLSAGEYDYALVDVENGDSVVLSGKIKGQFGLYETYNQAYSYNIGYTFTYAPISLSVTGGSLQSYWPGYAEMALQYNIISPPISPGMKNFTVDLTAGSGSVTIYAVPEPASMLVLLAGGLLALRRRGI